MVDVFDRHGVRFDPRLAGCSRFVRHSDYAALEAQLAERVKVKQLEWEEIHQRRSDEDPTTEWNGGYEADSALGYYEISMGFGSDAYYWTVSDPLSKDIGSDFEDPSDAKAAAQADFERRILSALEPAAPEERDAEDATHWMGAYDRMAARNVTLTNALVLAVGALDDLASGVGLSRPIEQIIRELNDCASSGGTTLTRPSEQAVTEEMVERLVQATRQYTLETLFIEEHRQLIRQALASKGGER